MLKTDEVGVHVFRDQQKKHCMKLNVMLHDARTPSSSTHYTFTLQRDGWAASHGAIKQLFLRSISVRSLFKEFTI